MLSALGGGFCGAFMPRRPGAVQCFGEGGLGLLLEEPTYRLYHCGRCAMQVCICAECDFGNLYCPGECAELARRDSVRRAGARYQATLWGARKHAARQRGYRERQREVTHHPWESAAAACSVSTPPVITSESIDAHSQQPVHRLIRAPQSRCAFCGKPCPPSARLHPWRWSG